VVSLASTLAAVNLIADQRVAACAQTLQGMFDDCRGELVVAGLGRVVYEGGVQRTAMHAPNPGIRIRPVGADCSIMLWLSWDDKVVDVELCDYVPGLGDVDALRVWAAALSRAFMTRPDMLARYTVLDNCSMAQVRSLPSSVWQAPPHVFGQRVLGSGDTCINVDCGVYSQGVVAYGRVPAEEVPPSTLVLLGANGGKAVTGAVLVMKHGPRGAVVFPSNAVAGLDAYPADKRVLQPLARDTAMAPRLVGALRSRTFGALTLEYETTEGRTAVSFDTVLAEVGPCLMYARDTASLLGELQGVLTLMKCKHAVTPGGIEYRRLDGLAASITIEYGADAAFDFDMWRSGGDAQVGDRLEDRFPDTISSELMMGCGLSGVARFMLRDHIVNNHLRGIEALYRPSRTPLVDTSGCLRIGGRRVAPAERVRTDYVVDLEYVQHKIHGQTASFVFAGGVARFVGGRYAGSALAVDASPDAAAFMTDPTVRAPEKHTYQQLADLPAVATPSELMRFVNRQRDNPQCRVWAKGRDNDQRLLSGRPLNGTVMLTPGTGGTPLREIGHLSPRFDDLVRSVGWSRTHNPVRECALFAFAAGLCTTLPAEAVLGYDTLSALEPEPDGVAA